NDLDSVGYTARHHTFFEMLGNWSFGDYFKQAAIEWAWELLTKVFGLSPEKLWVTVYHTDDDSWAIWKDLIGVAPERIVRIGDNKGAPFASDNFWQMADTGPCGPCTEIFYDHGADIPGGPPGSTNEDGDRYIEIWNLVFMQFDRAVDGTLSPLPAPCVDTGMGLERLAAVLQHVHSNYEIDLFVHLIDAAARLTNTRDRENKSLRVIADHIRACSFLIVDGVLPSNEGRNYVLRRIIRRALRHGWMLDVRGEFFWKMVAPLVAEMGEAYPELAKKQKFVEETLRAEEQRFGETLEQGMRIFDDVASRARDNAIAGVDAFKLYDTYGFPVDLTADIARERGLAVDMVGFERSMEEQRARARGASRFESKGQMPAELANKLRSTEFLGYETLEADGRIVSILRDGNAVAELAPGEKGVVVLDRTPFYAESGGQVGDTGALELAAGRFVVKDTQKLGGEFHAHVGEWKGAVPLGVGDNVHARVDVARRLATVLNHSATHLLHAALREVLGEHVTQKGSLVAPDRLRFDFSHFQPLAREELRRIEDIVNARIRSNDETEVHQMGYQEALEFGAM
ncbi:MAG: alanine--tRNA ligase, partial [Rhodanobacteraceae bacterium]